MKLLSRVVWAEGMYLAPQHFQAQNRYFEEAVHFATGCLWRDAYGLAACQLDPDALRNGTVSLLHARLIAIMADQAADVRADVDWLKDNTVAHETEARPR